MTERLTDKNFRLGFDDSNKLPGYEAIYEKLRKYETAEEGRLVVLPCMVGDTVYSVTLYNGICKHEIRKFITDGSNTYACSNCKFPITDFGIRVFLTREEAEKALEEMNKNE